jgi:hypothetical protein
MRVPGRYEVRVALVLRRAYRVALAIRRRGGRKTDGHRAIARTAQRTALPGVAMRAYPTPGCITLLVLSYMSSIWHGPKIDKRLFT